jgi:hypothetical protein
VLAEEIAGGFLVDEAKLPELPSRDLTTLQTMSITLTRPRW